jgi:hypothetical protein
VELVAWLIPIDPLVVIVPPVSGEVAVMDVTLPFPVPNGPTVELLIIAYTPAEVAQRSPFTGVVGAVPAPRFRPAAVAVEALVFSFPVIVPPDNGRASVIPYPERVVGVEVILDQGINGRSFEVSDLNEGVPLADAGEEKTRFWAWLLQPAVSVPDAVTGEFVTVNPTEVTVPTPVAHDKVPVPSFLRKVLTAPWLDGKLVVTLLTLIIFPVELTWNSEFGPTEKRETGLAFPIPAFPVL